VSLPLLPGTRRGSSENGKEAGAKGNGERTDGDPRGERSHQVYNVERTLRVEPKGEKKIGGVLNTSADKKKQRETRTRKEVRNSGAIAVINGEPMKRQGLRGKKFNLSSKRGGDECEGRC